MAELTLQEQDQEKRTQEFLVGKEESYTDIKQRVQRMLDAGHITQERALELLGTPRRLLRMSLTKILEKIWEDMSKGIVISQSLPRNIAQTYYEAYTRQRGFFFPGKPLGDFTNDMQQPPQNVLWYDTDALNIWKLAEKLRADRQRELESGGLHRHWGHGGSKSSSFEPERCPPPSLEECRQKLGI